MLTLALQTDSRGVTGVLVERPKVGAARLLGLATVARVATPIEIAEALRTALPKLRGAKPQLAVALGPDEVRVKRLAVPPAPDGELPPIVAMQAARDAAVDTESIVADFVPPQASAEGPPTVLAAWAASSTIDLWRAVAEALGGKLVAATPRALAAVPKSDVERVVYLSRAGDSIDFALFEAGVPTLLRSAHVGEADAERELRRTLLGLSEGEPAVRPLHAGLLAGAPVYAGWPELASAEPAGYEQSLAATGLGLAVASGHLPTLNLANPRKPPVQRTDRRRQLLLAGAAASVVAAGAWMAYDRVAQLDAAIADKDREIAAAEEEVEAFEPYRERVAALDGWRASDVTWLDELERLGRKLRPELFTSQEFAVESDLRATQVVATALVGGDEPGGRVDLAALARSSSTSALEERLRDGSHPVEPISTAETPAKDAYRYKYSVLLKVPAASQKDDSEQKPEAAE